MEAELALGRHNEVVSELDALAAEHPLRERLRGQLMLALYRLGHGPKRCAPTRRPVACWSTSWESSRARRSSSFTRRFCGRTGRWSSAQTTAPERSVLVAWLGDAACLGAAARGRGAARPEGTARGDRRPAALRSRQAHRRCRESEGARRCHSPQPASPRGSAVFTSDAPGADAARLAAEQDVDLVLVSAPAALLDDGDLGDLLRSRTVRRRRAHRRRAVARPGTRPLRRHRPRLERDRAGPVARRRAGKCRYASPGRGWRAAGTPADYWPAPPLLFSGPWVWPPSRSWSSRA